MAHFWLFSEERPEATTVETDHIARHTARYRMGKEHHSLNTSASGMEGPGMNPGPLFPVLLPLLGVQRSGNLETTQDGAEIPIHRLCFVVLRPTVRKEWKVHSR